MGFSICLAFFLVCGGLYRRCSAEPLSTAAVVGQSLKKKSNLCYLELLSRGGAHGRNVQRQIMTREKASVGTEWRRNEKSAHKPEKFMSVEFESIKFNFDGAGKPPVYRQTAAGGGDEQLFPSALSLFCSFFFPRPKMKYEDLIVCRTKAASS